MADDPSATGSPRNLGAASDFVGLSIGVGLFNRGLYWEAHEAWEHEWVPDRQGRARGGARSPSPVPLPRGTSPAPPTRRRCGGGLAGGRAPPPPALVGRKPPAGPRLDEASVPEPQQVLGVRAPVGEHEREQQVE